MAAERIEQFLPVPERVPRFFGASNWQNQELHAKYPDSPNVNNIAGEVQPVYDQSQ